MDPQFSISSTQSNPAMHLLESLSRSVVNVPNTDNASVNRKLWDAYAVAWDESPKPTWLDTMATAVGKVPGDLSCVGDEWATDADVEAVLTSYVRPYVKPTCRVLEVGSGGGRITSKILDMVPNGNVTCADISAKMLTSCKRAVETLHPGAMASGRINFIHIPPGQEAGMDLSVLNSAGQFDMIIIFDVLVHCGLLQQHAFATRMSGHADPTHPAWLAPHAKAFISTSNLLAPLGWARFMKSKQESVQGFVWTSPDAVDAIIHRTGLRIVQRSWPRPEGSAEGALVQRSMYEERDYLLLLEMG